MFWEPIEVLLRSGHEKKHIMESEIRTTKHGRWPLMASMSSFRRVYSEQDTEGPMLYTLILTESSHNTVAVNKSSQESKTSVSKRVLCL